MAIVSLQRAATWLGLDHRTFPERDLGLLQFLVPQAERLVKKFLGFDIEYATYTEYHPRTTYGAPQDPLITGWELQGGRATPVERFADERRILQVYQLPLRSISSVYEDPSAWQNGTPPNFQTLLVPQDYQADFQTYDPGTNLGIAWSGFIIRTSGIWINWARSIKVTYTAGLKPAELDPITGVYTEFATAILCAVQVWFGAVKAHQPRQAQGQSPGAVQSESLEGYSGSYNQDDIGLNYAFCNELPQVSKKILEEYVRLSKFV